MFRKELNLSYYNCKIDLSQGQVLYTPRVLRINLSIQTNYFKDFNIIWRSNILMKVIPETYLMKVIPETYLMKVILSVPDEGYSERT